MDGAVKPSELDLALAFDGAPVGMGVVAPDGRFLKVNRAFCHLLGRDEGELLTLSFARRRLSEARALSLNGLVREQAAFLGRTTFQKVRLELDLDEALPPIQGDPAALSHALMNLCVNAVDAMPDGGTLVLRTRREEDQAILEVADTGHGMPEDVLAKAMEPFFTTKPLGKGTGLGLPMVYGTVKAHQGSMTVRSEPGRGTRIRMAFPGCAPSAPEPDPAAAAAVRTRGAALSLLLVDDDELVRTAVRTLLEALGHQVAVAGGGEEALSWLKLGRPVDAVILDMNMPGMNGAQTLPGLRALRPDLPVLLATGEVDEKVVALAASHPGVQTLLKPFSIEELLHLLPATQGWHP